MWFYINTINSYYFNVKFVKNVKFIRHFCVAVTYLYFFYREEKPSIKELSKEHTQIEEISPSEENKLPSSELIEGEEGSEGSESEKSNTGRDFVMV